jgi:hypothetical protein
MRMNARGGRVCSHPGPRASLELGLYAHAGFARAEDGRGLLHIHAGVALQQRWDEEGVGDASRNLRESEHGGEWSRSHDADEGVEGVCGEARVGGSGRVRGHRHQWDEGEGARSSTG